jgi:hypothetical protein
VLPRAFQGLEPLGGAILGAAKRFAQLAPAPELLRYAHQLLLGGRGGRG